MSTPGFDEAALLSITSPSCTASRWAACPPESISELDRGLQPARRHAPTLEASGCDPYLRNVQSAWEVDRQLSERDARGDPRFVLREDVGHRLAARLRDITLEESTRVEVERQKRSSRSAAKISSDEAVPS